MTAAFTGADALGVHLSSGQAIGDGLGGDFCELEFRGFLPFVTGPGLGRCRIDALSRDGNWRSGSIQVVGGSIGLMAVAADGTEHTGTDTLAAPGAYQVLSAGPFWVRVFWEPDYTPATESGVLEFSVVREYNNALGQGDSDEDQRAGGFVQHGCIFLYAHEALTLDTITDLGRDGASLRFALEIATGFETQRIADRTTPPTGLTWNDGTWACDLDLAAGDAVKLWVESTQDAGTVPGIGENGISLGFTVGANAHSTELSGLFRAADSSLAGYLVYGSTAGELGGTLLATETALPFDVPITPPETGEDTWRFRVGRRNAYNLESLEALNPHRVTVDHLGENQTLPDAPSKVTVDLEGGGILVVRARYVQQQGHPAATGWRVDVSLDTGAFESYSRKMNTVDDHGRHSLELRTDAFPWGAVATVQVFSTLEETAAGADPIEKTISSTDPTSLVSAGGVLSHTTGLHQPADLLTAWRVWSPDGPLFTSWPGRVQLAHSGTTVFTARASGLGVYVQTDFDLVNGDLTAPFETEGETLFCLRVGTLPVLKVDLTAGTLTAAAFGSIAQDCPVSGVYHDTAHSRYFQIYDLSAMAWKTWLQLDDDGTIRFGKRLVQP